MVGAKMTASELAKLLEVDSWYKLVTREEIATMLRQQQAEIEALKQIIDANNLSQNIGQFVKPTNEPVAWMETYKGEPNNLDWDKSNLNYGSEFHNVVPLYTHPVKELTDEEIRHIQAQCHLKNVGYDNFIMRFARAILRKAQEK
jgi:hypothetical protein